jgi:eukaryotic-like serine/threonine-protein kinase
METKPDNPLREIFLEAAELDDPGARAAYLDAACGNDTSLRQRVEALLAAEAGAGPPPAAAEAPIGDVLPGSRIGSYRLQQQIGEGGCGVVFMAEQEQPVRRRVALKVIKLGMDTKQVVARFDAERQALAMMDHPNIARVFDAGATESGRPYFVMELVRGIRITEYCDQQRFPARRRLDLFIQVCQAVQHAHQKGIIHRDLKPSNILVTEVDGRPVPKIIDFGIAKAVSGRLTDQTLFTAFEQLIGTPAYMSPEQAALNAADIDTRSDIYSLGVLLYELLTGETPFDTKALLASGVDELRRTIREVDPVRPSTRLTQLAVARNSVADRRSQIANDLDWIVMKCLEKERDRRYETANGLAMDIQRHLNCEPVVARPPSRWYEFQKTVRRHKFGFAAAAAIMLVLVAGVLVSSRQAVRARNAEREAQGYAYASDMNLAQQALEADNAGQTQTLLDRHRPRPGQSDLREWEWRYLWGQLQSDAHSTLTQQAHAIHSLDVSSDGRWLVIGEQHHGGLTVWDLQTQQEALRLPDVKGQVLAAFSPRPSLLAFSTVSNFVAGSARYASFSGAAAKPGAPLTTGPQHSVWVWDLEANRVVSELPTGAPCRGLAFSPDGQTLITSTAGPEGTLTVWSIPDGQPRRVLAVEQTNDDKGRTFAVAPNFSLAAQGTPRAELRVIELTTGSVLWQTDVAVAALAFSPDGELLAVGEGQHQAPLIRLFNASTGREVGSLAGHQERINAVVFWPDGRRLASASGDQTLRVWNLQDPAHPTLESTLRGHRHEVWALTLVPDGKSLVSGCKNGTVSLWDGTRIQKPENPVTLPGTFRTWRFSSGGETLLTCDPMGRVHRWDGPGFRRNQPLLEFGPEESYPRFSADARKLATRSTTGVIRVWDVERASLLRELTPTSDPGYPWAFLGRGDRIVSYHPAASSLQEWDLATGRFLRTWQCPPAMETGAFSADEKWCLMLGYEGDCVLRDLTTGRQFSPDPEILYARDATFSPDGNLLAATTDFGFARLWDTRTRRAVATLTGFPLGAHSIAFTPNGTRLAIGGAGRDGTDLWDVHMKRELLSFKGNGEITQSVAFSPDGNLLGSLDSRGNLQVWRAPTWEEINAAESSTGSPLQASPR